MLWTLSLLPEISGQHAQVLQPGGLKDLHLQQQGDTRAAGIGSHLGSGYTPT